MWSSVAGGEHRCRVDAEVFREAAAESQQMGEGGGKASSGQMEVELRVRVG